MNFFNRADDVISFVPPWKTIVVFVIGVSAAAACVIGVLLAYS